jgi:hypothetical protein
MASTDYSASENVTSTVMKPGTGTREADRSSTVSAVSTTYYAMRAIDVDAAGVTYVTWVVQGTPDTNGKGYTGTKSGSSALSNITVVAQWTV